MNHFGFVYSPRLLAEALAAFGRTHDRRYRVFAVGPVVLLWQTKAAPNDDHRPRAKAPRPITRKAREAGKTGGQDR